MLAYWLMFGALVAAALYLLLRPLLHAPSGDTDRKSLNLRVFRERLAELENERAAGRLEEAEFLPLKRDLELKLLEDIPEPVGEGATRPHSVLPWLWSLFLAVPALTLSLYLTLGEHRTAEVWQSARDSGADLQDIATAIDAAGTAQDMPGMQFAVLRLRALLMAEPDNTEAWYALGRTYMGLDEPEAGVAALEQGYRRAPDDVAMMVGYAQGLVLANQGQGTEESERLLRKAVALDPRHQGALMLLGFSAYNAGRYAEAIELWQRLKALRPADSEGAKLLEQSIAQARTRLAVANTTQLDQPVAAAAGLDVEVRLADALKAKIAPGDRVFIFARAAEGPPMPLAVVTTEAGKLPLSVRLSDEQAMMPTLKLSGFERVVVGARLSKSGQATPQPGDFEGLSAPFVQAEQKAPLTIIIEHIRP